MKKILLFLFVAGFAAMQLSAQESTFNKGDKVLNLGIGFGSTLYSGSYYKTQIPPLSASLEVGVADNVLEKGVIGVGGYLGFTSYKYEYANGGFKSSNVIIGARGNFHYPLVEKLDTYTGLLLGYRTLSVNYFGGYGSSDFNGTASGLQWAWFIGGRYYFKDNLAAMLELGYGVAYFNLGVALKF